MGMARAGNASAPGVDICGKRIPVRASTHPTRIVAQRGTRVGRVARVRTDGVSRVACEDRWGVSRVACEGPVARVLAHAKGGRFAAR